MPPRAESRWPRIVLGYVLFGGLLAVAMTPLYFAVGPAHRALVVRLGAALFVGVALVHLRRIAREAMAGQPVSAFAEAPQPAAAEQHVAPLLQKLRDEVRISTTDQRYFEHILWVRILRILRCREEGASAPPAMPQGRRFLRRGPSLPAIHELIAKIEERS